MRASRQWAGHVCALLGETTSTWWACLPRLLTIQLVTTTGSQLLRLLAAVVSPYQAWVAIFLIAAGFVLLLSGLVISLRIVGDHLKVNETVADSGPSPRMSQLLSVTLLPFLGIYASLGVVESAAKEVTILGSFLHGLGTSTLAALDPRTQRQYLVVAAVVIGAYLVRRLVDLVYDRTGIRALGLVAALVEAFFMLSLLVAGMRLVRTGLAWLASRHLMDWLAETGQALAAPFRLLKIDLPEVVDLVWAWIQTTGWPAVSQTFAEPVLWLAITALVTGSGVLSIADLWRHSETPDLLSGSERRSARRLAHRMRTSSRLRSGWLTFQETFLGDIDDKYLPTWQSLRLTLRVGLTFLGAYLLVFTMMTVSVQLVVYGIKVLIGGGSTVFWGAFVPVLDLIERLLLEPVRVSLLVVAFRRASTWSVPEPSRALPEVVAP